MNFFRAALAGIMALLVSMPFALCEEDCFAEAPSCEHSCCCEQHSDAEAACSCSCVDECQSLHFEQRDFLSTNSEVTAPDASEATEIENSPLFEELLLSSLSQATNGLRAPPDLFTQASRRIIHCVYRL